MASSSPPPPPPPNIFKLARVSRCSTSVNNTVNPSLNDNISTSPSRIPPLRRAKTSANPEQEGWRRQPLVELTNHFLRVRGAREEIRHNDRRSTLGSPSTPTRYLTPSHRPTNRRTRNTPNATVDSSSSDEGGMHVTSPTTTTRRLRRTTTGAMMGLIASNTTTSNINSSSSPFPTGIGERRRTTRNSRTVTAPDEGEGAMREGRGGRAGLRRRPSNSSFR